MTYYCHSFITTSSRSSPSVVGMLVLFKIIYTFTTTIPSSISINLIGYGTLAEWLTRCPAKAIPSGACVRITQVSIKLSSCIFFCMPGDITITQAFFDFIKNLESLLRHILIVG
jgi:hypothetical protein